MNSHWNWQKEDWPNFTYDKDVLEHYEQIFLLNSGKLLGIAKHFDDAEQQSILIELISEEALKTSEIEGEFLNRDSLQSSIKKHFGLIKLQNKNYPAENGIAEMMINLFHTSLDDLTNNNLFLWHKLLMNGRSDLDSIGKYRTHKESMIVISDAPHKPNIYFEAPSSKVIPAEMQGFINWFNITRPNNSSSLPALIRAGICHLYFECIHPFEDGNGRIGRALIEKSLSQSLNAPTLISLSLTINNQKKTYYKALEDNNKQLNITPWLLYFSELIIKAQENSLKQIEFIIIKTKFFDKHKSELNIRQSKVIARMFQEGPNGFIGGLSAQNYMAISKASPSTATRDLGDLIKKSILYKIGEKKSTRYYLNIKF